MRKIFVGGLTSLIAVSMFTTFPVSASEPSLANVSKNNIVDSSVENVPEDILVQFIEEAESAGYEHRVSPEGEFQKNNNTQDTGGFLYNPGSDFDPMIRGSKTLTEGDFVAGAIVVNFKIGLITGGSGSISLNLLGQFLGIATSAVPDTLPGEKVYYERHIRWIDREQYEFEVYNVEYLYRDGKRLKLFDSYVEGDGNE